MEVTLEKFVLSVEDKMRECQSVSLTRTAALTSYQFRKLRETHIEEQLIHLVEAVIDKVGSDICTKWDVGERDTLFYMVFDVVKWWEKSKKAMDWDDKDAISKTAAFLVSCKAPEIHKRYYDKLGEEGFYARIYEIICDSRKDEQWKVDGGSYE